MFDTGSQLRKARKNANFTLDQLAALSGIDRGTISRIELGHVSPRIDTIDCLCKAMNISLPIFFNREDWHTAPSEPQAGPPPSIDKDAPGIRPGEDNYWPVPSLIWQSLVDVVERFEALLANSGEMVLVMDRNGKIVYLSPGGEAILGFRRQELVGSHALDLIHPDDRPRFASILEGSGPGAATSPEFRMKQKDGSWSRLVCNIADHRHNPSVRALILNAAPPANI